MIHSTRPEDTYEEQLNAVANAYNDLLAGELKGAMAVFKRYFLSDTANQADLLLAITTESSDCALSVVEQPPLDGTKIALWAYLQTNVQTQVLHNGLFEVNTMRIAICGEVVLSIVLLILNTRPVCC